MKLTPNQGSFIFCAFMGFIFIFATVLAPHFMEQNRKEWNEEFRQKKIYGLVAKKQRIPEHHNSLYVWIVINENRDTLSYDIPDYNPTLYENVQAGDSIAKDKGTSICKIYRNKKYHTTASLTY